MLKSVKIGLSKQKYISAKFVPAEFTEDYYIAQCFECDFFLYPSPATRFPLRGILCYSGGCGGCVAWRVGNACRGDGVTGVLRLRVGCAPGACLGCPTGCPQLLWRGYRYASLRLLVSRARRLLVAAASRAFRARRPGTHGQFGRRCQALPGARPGRAAGGLPLASRP